MFCDKCGREIPNNSAFCGFCGAPSEDMPEQPQYGGYQYEQYEQYPPKSSARRTWIIPVVVAGICCITLAAVAGIVIFSNNGDDNKSDDGTVQAAEVQTAQQAQEESLPEQTEAETEQPAEEAGDIGGMDGDAVPLVPDGLDHSIPYNPPDVDINGGSYTARTIDGSAYGYKAINFRIGPSKDFPTLSLPNDRTAIDNGKTVYEYARYYEADADEFWSYIEWNGYTGWVMTRYTK
ncbi:zinc-ribbon domain-containing protein [Ruminococcus sp. 210702-SL.1.03]|uniref:zinc-ribbon domain-containing protein n=1 Tax=Ruminococcus sp. 210702-SL.1.03 TaxID=2883233 RepID=UPI001D07B560|nr:zinc ribbon domain-containing protein [Ruminococcus sp. 210702-SL.1.03]MCB6615889.1 zinc ribbon domain-containing protein [Ruminococcus sp. 210702-SL.1.03]